MHGPIATHRSATGVPTGRLAVWWLLASEIFIFGGLVTCFVLFKLNGTPGFEDASLTSVTAGAINTFVLLTSSLSIVLAHAVTLVREASSNPGVPFSLKSTKQVTKPPKIKISEARSHQTANRPVGTPVALRCVAIGPCIDIFNPFF
jgi:hypothetical protein